MGKASVWLVANAAFGLAPLAFLWVINPLLKEHDAEQAIHELMRVEEISPDGPNVTDVFTQSSYALLTSNDRMPLA